MFSGRVPRCRFAVRVGTTRWDRCIKGVFFFKVRRIGIRRDRRPGRSFVFERGAERCAASASGWQIDDVGVRNERLTLLCFCHRLIAFKPEWV